MVRTACGDDPPSAYTRPIGALEERAKGPMPKQRKRRAPSPRKVSSAKQPSGLIVTANRPPQSAGTKSALGNRSHRTTPSAYTRPIGALEEGARGPMPKQRKR